MKKLPSKYSIAKEINYEFLKKDIFIVTYFSMSVLKSCYVDFSFKEFPEFSFIVIRSRGTYLLLVLHNLDSLKNSWYV